jgi:CBS domain-containing protein
MTIHETMRDILRNKGQQIWSIDPDATVYEAIEIMAEKHIGALLVMSGDVLHGIVMDRDYARRVFLKGRSSKDMLIKEIMTSPVIVVDPGKTVDESLRIMNQNRIRYLPVVENEKVIGVVSLGDLVTWIMTSQKYTIEQLQGYITGKPA